MKLKEFIGLIEDICPLDLMEEWDNSGPQISFTNKEIKNVLVSLDITKAVIDEAIAKNIDLIITHHPLYFGDVKQISDDGLGYTIELIKNEISVYSCHTNFDKLNGGNNDFIGNMLGIKDVKVAENTDGFGRIGSLEQPKTIESLIKEISVKFNIDVKEMRYIGNTDINIDKLCWCSGAGADFLLTSAGYALGADLYITGDVKYHDAMYAKEIGMNVLDIGHFGSEIIFLPNMSKLLENRLLKEGNQDDVNVMESTENQNPFMVFLMI